MDFLQSLQPWHWLVFCFLMLAMEALGAGGFLLGSAAAALLLALMTWMMPSLDWASQMIWFGVGSLVFTLAYWKLFRRVNEKTDHHELNQRAAQLVGRAVVLEEELLPGLGRVQVGDTLWKVDAEQSYEKGSRVKIVGYEGMILKIESC
ncbi:NfeD family protein [Endozoicomonas sp. OPT23]|uniref:NfeD family protein n=1 Tax=Endozoicomonas sp. OPT23 TaxID=2072845 RepID=UPI00129AFC99|nr:NfeD family protein [Endozoicomonas sp. OPT23]MRI34222.1 NfeD family protein [Endozoicomonas sp. OPT23]